MTHLPVWLRIGKLRQSTTGEADPRRVRLTSLFRPALQVPLLASLPVVLEVMGAHRANNVVVERAMLVLKGLIGAPGAAVSA